MTPIEFLLCPWNEEKIAAIIEYAERERLKNESLRKSRIENLENKILDFTESIKILEDSLKSNQGNEDFEDYIYKEIQGLYPLRRKKISDLLELGELKFLSTITTSGEKETFKIEEENFSVKDKQGIYFKISELGNSSWKHFIFKIIFLDNKILIYYIDNQGIPELEKKGIVKAMIEALRKKYKMKIVSSSNKESLKIDEAEGRVPNVTQFWKKWEKQEDKIIFNSVEDRFEYLV